MAGDGYEGLRIEAALNLAGHCGELLVCEALSAHDTVQMILCSFHSCLPEPSDVRGSLRNTLPLYSL